MSSPGDYGSKYWCITGEGEPLFLFADRLEVMPSGALVAWGGYRKDGADEAPKPIAVYGIAKGQWQTFYAASGDSGEMVASDCFQ